MINIFLSILFATFSFQFFYIGVRTSAVNKSLVMLPKAIFEASTYVLATNEAPYFIKEKLENNIDIYFKTSLKKYVDDYRLYFFYYDIYDHQICMDEHCQGLEVTLRARISSFYSYKRTIFYEIKEN